MKLTIGDLETNEIDNRNNKWIQKEKSKEKEYDAEIKRIFKWNTQKKKKADINIKQTEFIKQFYYYQQDYLCWA